MAARRQCTELPITLTAVSKLTTVTIISHVIHYVSCERENGYQELAGMCEILPTTSTTN